MADAVSEYIWEPWASVFSLLCHWSLRSAACGDHSICTSVQAHKIVSFTELSFMEQLSFKYIGYQNTVSNDSAQHIFCGLKLLLFRSVRSVSSTFGRCFKCVIYMFFSTLHLEMTCGILVCYWNNTRKCPGCLTTKASVRKCLVPHQQMLFCVFWLVNILSSAVLCYNCDQPLNYLRFSKSGPIVELNLCLSVFLIFKIVYAIENSFWVFRS